MANTSKVQKQARAAKKNINDEADKVAAERLEQKLETMAVTPASAWTSGLKPVKLLLPSGNVCEAINKGLNTFVEEGLIPNSLMGIVGKALEEGKEMTAVDIKAVSEDPDTLRDTIKLMNAITVGCVINPEILSNLNKDGEVIRLQDRDPEGLYVDTLDDTDKLFVFQWVTGGTRDVERFRREQANAVASVAGLEKVAQKAK